MTDSPLGHEAEIARFFWAARREHVRGEAGPAHEEAVEFALRHGHGWLEHLLEASRRGKEAPEGALEILEASERDVPEDARGLVDVLRGWALYNLGQSEESIALYRQALENPGYRIPDYACVSLGTLFFEKGDFEEALVAYSRALEVPDNENLGNAWLGLGATLGVTGDLEEAIVAFKRALETPNYDNRAQVWNNLGTAYLEKGDLEDATHAFEMANELARDDSERARSRLGLQTVESRLKLEELTPDDRALLQEPTRESGGESIESRLIDKINQAGSTQYDLYVEKKDSGRHDSLNVLRGWSSSVTLLDGSDRMWRGGGYFLKWRGFGVVIDPGFDFLRNFHDAKFHAREVSAVLISHNHPDHNSDLKDIDDLRYELHKRIAGLKPYVVVWDQDTDRVVRFQSEVAGHRIDPIVVSRSRPLPVDLSQDDRAQIPVRVLPFKVEHGEDVRSALGMTVELLDEEGAVAFRLGYTADTRYFEGLATRLQGCNALIAHVSQPTIKELQDPSELKSTHLGYRGTARLLRECQPTLALLGEFWAGFADLRIDLAKGIRQRSGLEHVLPTGIGMHLALPSLDIECTECGTGTPYTEIRVAPPTETFGALTYLCPSCLLD